MAEISVQSTAKWSFLAGLLILYAPQPYAFHVDERSSREGSYSIPCSDRITTIAAQSIPRLRRQSNSSVSSDEEDISHAMWLSRHSSQPGAFDPYGAGPSSRADQDECPVVRKRRRNATSKKNCQKSVFNFLNSTLTKHTREKFRSLIRIKVPDIESVQLNAIVRSFTGQKTPSWDHEEREYFICGFLVPSPVGWNRATCEEYLRAYFQTESPGWSVKQQQYVIEHLSDSPSQGFNAEDREFYLEGFLLSRPSCWPNGLRAVFTELFNRNIPRGEELTYGPLLESFLYAPPNCWSDEQRREVVYGFLQGPPRGWSPEQRLQFMHRFADVPFENRCLFFQEGRFIPIRRNPPRVGPRRIHKECNSSIRAEL